MKITTAMRLLAWGILNQDKKREEAIADDNSDLIFEIECEQRDLADTLANLILEEGN